MIILDKNYYIDNTDGLNYILYKKQIQKKDDPSKEERFKVVGYFSNLANAIKRYAEEVFGEENKTKDFTIGEAVERLRKIYNDALNLTFVGEKK